MTYCYVRVELSGVFEKKKTVVYYDNCRRTKGLQDRGILIIDNWKMRGRRRKSISNTAFVSDFFGGSVDAPFLYGFFGVCASLWLLRIMRVFERRVCVCHYEYWFATPPRCPQRSTAICMFSSTYQLLNYVVVCDLFLVCGILCSFCMYALVCFFS